MSVNIFQSMNGTDPQMLTNNTTGKYYYRKNGKVAVMVSRNVLFVTSEILDEDTRVNMELPEHPAFFLHCISANGDMNILIGKNENLSVSIKSNYQIQAVCPL